MNNEKIKNSSNKKVRNSDFINSELDDEIDFKDINDKKQYLIDKYES